MSYSRSTSVVSRVFDAVLRRKSWPLALEAVAETVGAIGAAYIVRSKETARVGWISLSGPRTALEANCSAKRHDCSTSSRVLRWKSSVGQRAPDQLAAGVIVTDPRGGQIEINRAAETILRRGDALRIRERRLCARRTCRKRDAIHSRRRRQK
jgi:hypothetical protein